MQYQQPYQWAVVGAGPAGIAAVGKLIDQQIDPKQILWIDPAFAVGDFGRLWCHVSSNTRVGLFLQFLHARQAFRFNERPKDYELLHLDPDKTCRLHYMVEPLQWVTQQLQQRVATATAQVEKLALRHRHWELSWEGQLACAKQVILAIGAEPKVLVHAGPEVVPLSQAMDAERVAQSFNHDDTVAVFGSSHSAILVVRELIELGVREVVNFYRAPLKYAVYLDDWILFDDTGLKGTTAEWARAHIDGKQPAALTRVLSNEQQIAHHLPRCNKVVYAVGFEQRKQLQVEGLQTLAYNDRSGIIAPGLFGLGIAFPEGKVNPFGTLEYRVGLWKFMDYLNRAMPVWLKYGT